MALGFPTPDEVALRIARMNGVQAGWRCRHMTLWHDLLAFEPKGWIFRLSYRRQAGHIVATVFWPVADNKIIRPYELPEAAYTVRLPINTAPADVIKVMIDKFETMLNTEWEACIQEATVNRLVATN